MANKIKISVILPVSGSIPDPGQLQKQTGKDIQFVLADCRPLNGISGIPEKIQTDSRTIVLSLPGVKNAEALNRCVSAAEGEYLYFFDSSVTLESEYLLTMYAKASSVNADMIISAHKEINFHREEEWFPALKLCPQNSVFNYEEFPQKIIGSASLMLWNKLFKRQLIMNHKIGFAEASAAEKSFCAMALLCADRIAFADDITCFGYRADYSADQADILINVNRILTDAMGLPYYNEIRPSVISFVTELLAEALIHSSRDFETQETHSFYKAVHELAVHGGFSEISKKEMDSRAYRWLQIFRGYSWDELYGLVHGRKLTVSLTTYPGRIHIVSKTIQTIYEQTRKADRVVLWLADSQFPRREEDLPGDLMKLANENRLTVRWCQDLKPHKKYLFAMEEYPEDLLVTVDDDLYYDPMMLEYLFLSWLEYPQYVSACRTHLIAMDEEQHFLPYSEWIKETNLVLNEPCMELFATGGAGTLYPPHLFDEKLLDPDLVQKLCPIADDLWLKTMEILKDIPVVQAYPFDNLWYVDNSQEEGLVYENVEKNKNDIQLDQIREWADRQYGTSCLEKRIINSQNSAYPYGFYRISLKFRPIMEENERLRQEYKTLRNDFDNVVNSVSFKTGRTITSLPRNVRDLFKRK